ncbi:MAG: cbb3-type cytochrome c oxidase subunit I [Deltaproteobacteria bacterium]|nr:cbb3-type cytochrome c oxidase subunit I [Deltaproteobacteria bacterium]
MSNPALDNKRITVVYTVTALLVFLVLALLGWVMRLTQSGMVQLPSDAFYSVMTLHGLGMAGVMYTGAYAALWYLLSGYVQPSLKLMKINFVLILLGVVGLIGATLIGGFGAGWYVLYPLPFIEQWPRWSSLLAIVSLVLLGVAWLLGQLDLLRVLAQRYGLGGMLAWPTLFGKKSEAVPPLVLVAAINLLAGALTTVVGAVMLVLYLFQWMEPTVSLDALLMKNMVFLFGHTLVNITLYFGIAAIYELFPKYSGRPWVTNRVVALSWNVTFVLVMLVFFHHLYMDFANNIALHYIGQVGSYLSAIPATVVTVFGVLAQINRSGIRWSFVPLTFTLGVMGWIIGGFAAIVDTTIAINLTFHNTQWVPAHFHTYFLLGFAVMLFGIFYHLLEPEAEKLAKTSLAAILVGGYGFVTMFYLGGVNSVPRRFSGYEAVQTGTIAQTGHDLAVYAVGFAAILLVGVLLYYAAVFRRIGAAWNRA